jgi:hypothetical protein
VSYIVVTAGYEDVKHFKEMQTIRTSISEFRKACSGLPYFVLVEKPPTEYAGHNDVRKTEIQ